MEQHHLVRPPGIADGRLEARSEFRDVVGRPVRDVERPRPVRAGRTAVTSVRAGELPIAEDAPEVVGAIAAVVAVREPKQLAGRITLARS